MNTHPSPSPSTVRLLGTEYAVTHAPTRLKAPLVFDHQQRTITIDRSTPIESRSAVFYFEILDRINTDENPPKLLSLLWIELESLHLCDNLLSVWLGARQPHNYGDHKCLQQETLSPP